MRLAAPLKTLALRFLPEPVLQHVRRAHYLRKLATALPEPDMDVLKAMGHAYVEMLSTQREYLMLQHQAYAACDDEVIRDAVRTAYAHLVEHVRELSGVEAERLDEFFRYGAWLNIAAAMGVADLSVGCEWMRLEAQASDPAQSS